MCTSPFLRCLHHHDRYFDKTYRSKNGGFYIWDRHTVEILLADSVAASDFQQLPCGSCLECRIKRRSEWTDRLLTESFYHPLSSCWFLTLTFAPGTEPGGSWITLDPDCSGSKIEVFGELSKRFLSSWIKRFRERVRDRYGVSIRFFGCGEYGESGHRAHYHLLVFGLPWDQSDLVRLKTTPSGVIYRCPWLEECWPYGFSVVAPFSRETAQYVAGYVTKKLTGVARERYLAMCNDNQVKPLPAEFVLMSRRPGIGYRYIAENAPTMRMTGRLSVAGRAAYPGRYADYRLSLDESPVDHLVRKHYKAVRSVHLRSASERDRDNGILARRFARIRRDRLLSI